ncbi:MAG TPA: DUF169 domain-containing protein [Methylomirabilota bacterium]|jgi:uncharacterized protein (DUF169 family)|nr:DUF169 domain-containing protein [Methylomirabilota bacterium]
MPDWKALDARLTDLLKLDRAPVAVSFCDAVPAGVRKFEGSVPSGCSFWKVAATAPAGKAAFYTVAADHQNCPIGAHTHNIPQADGGKMLNEMLGMMSGIGYVKMEEVPQIPRWPKTPAAVVYARLREAPVAPDAVIFACRASAAMYLGEAARAAGVASSMPPLPRPTCMAIPAAAAGGATMSLGCIGNRVYTGIEDDHVYLMVRGGDLEKVAGALEKIMGANAQLAAFHSSRRPGLTTGEAARV